MGLSGVEIRQPVVVEQSMTMVLRRVMGHDANHHVKEELIYRRQSPNVGGTKHIVVWPKDKEANGAQDGVHDENFDQLGHHFRGGRCVLARLDLVPVEELWPLVVVEHGVK